MVGVGDFIGKKDSPDNEIMNKPLTNIERDRVKVLLLSFLIVIVFWGAFEQAGGLMNIYAFEKTNRMIQSINFEVPATWFHEKRRKLLTLVDKANVLETSRLWRDIVQNISNEYKNVEVEYLFVDNAAMKIITNPSHFDVILTENMFGDIITDEASVITGSLGMLPSASIGDKISLFEPIHGSYPKATGKNIANPMAMILSASMMLDLSFGLKKYSEIIEKSVSDALDNGIVTEDINKEKNYSTTYVGSWISERVKKLL
jgi:isocitrate/isopropylmalate dehydrogenase